RFRTGDIGTVNREPCPCGRTHARINIIGRLDDMLIVSGVNVFPSDIEFAIRGAEDLTVNTGLPPLRKTSLPDSMWKWKEVPALKRIRTQLPKRCLRKSKQGLE
ncbi:MAG: hypothetical protein ACYDHX_17230, partial [Methanothrix sp.]